MQAIEIAHAPVAQLDRVTDYESVGQGFESLLAYQNGYLRVSVLFYFRDSKIKMQQSGGLLLMPGSTGMTPLLPPFPGRQRKRVLLPQPTLRIDLDIGAEKSETITVSDFFFEFFRS